jgi:hypothetical protein
VLPGDPLVRVHRLQQPQQHALRHRRHRSVDRRRSGAEGGFGGFGWAERFGGRERERFEEERERDVGV